MTNRPPDEPLTCSEVVERLHEAHIMNRNESFRSQATKILDEWRERRVQELEELAATCPCCKAALTLHLEGGQVTFVAGKPPNSEWREQIRKGANHD